MLGLACRVGPGGVETRAQEEKSQDGGESCMLSILGHKERVDKGVETDETSWAGRAVRSWWVSEP